MEQRSVYASPFPMTATIDELTACFAAHCAKQVLSIRLRRHITSKDFKGSIFLELEVRPNSCTSVGINLTNHPRSRHMSFVVNDPSQNGTYRTLVVHICDTNIIPRALYLPSFIHIVMA